MEATTHDLISRLRAEPGNRVREIAAKSGVPYPTLRNWRYVKREVDPRSSNLDRLRHYYDSLAA